MLAQLLFTNLYFTIKVFASLVFFATGWLHFGSWSLVKKDKTLLARATGFFLLSLVSIFQATTIEIEALVFLSQIIKILGLTIILSSLIKEPLLSPPKKEALGISLPLLSQSLIPLSAVLHLIIGLIYFRKSTEGYEKQIKPLFYAFFMLSISEFITIFFLASNTHLVFFSKILAQFGTFWIAAYIAELIGVGILGIWTWGYLRFRAQAQLFIIFITSSLIIFTATTFSFTYLLLKNVENDALGHLKTDVEVLHYALNRLQAESLADAKVISENSVIKDAFNSEDSQKLYDATLEFMISQETSFLDIASSSGKVLMRAEDNEKTGDSLSEDTVVQSALKGIPLATVAIIEKPIAPDVQIRASAPIIENNKFVGVVITGFNIDSAFVDGVKEITGLDTSIFAGGIRAATTFKASDGKSRFIGTKESNSEVLSKVLQKGEIFIGPTEVLNRPFYAAYLPLKTAEGQVIGMLFVGKLQTELYEAAERSIQLTFLGSVILMLLSTIPAYFVAKYIKENIKA